MRVSISSEALAAIRAHADEEPGREVCGLLLGRSGHVTTALRTANVADDPSRDFEIEPRALIAAYRSERMGGHQLLGSYHSHPDGHALPSETDLACSAGDGKLWVIVAGGEVRAWASYPARFVPVQLFVS